MIEVLVALAIAVGLVGIIVPVLPGSLLVIGAILVWAISIGSPEGWIVFSVAAIFIATGALVKFVVPGRRLKGAGVPNTTLWIGAGLGVIGFFVVPVIGLFLGFVLGVFLAEVNRLDLAQAWPSTVHALKAVGLGMAIELLAAVLAALIWGASLVLL